MSAWTTGRRSARVRGAESQLARGLFQAGLVDEFFAFEGGRSQAVVSQLVDLPREAVGPPVQIPGDLAGEERPVTTCPAQVGCQVGLDLLFRQRLQVVAEEQAAPDLLQAGLYRDRLLCVLGDTHFPAPPPGS